MRHALLLLLSLSALPACNQAAPAPAADEKTTLLTAKRWRLTAFTVLSISNGFGNTTDYYAVSPACQRDDFTTFKPDKSVVFDEGPTKCLASNPQTSTSQWQWEDNQTSLTYVSASGFSGMVKCELLALTATILQLRYTKQAPGSTDLLRQEWTYTAF